MMGDLPERIWLFQPYHEFADRLMGLDDLWFEEKDLNDHDIQDGVRHEYVPASKLDAVSAELLRLREENARLRPILNAMSPDALRDAASVLSALPIDKGVEG
jgi:hypothetical protein